MAISVGAPMTELDVHQTADGLLVVHHDDAVAGLAIASNRLDALRQASRSHGYEIPLLSEVLALCWGQIQLDIDVKKPGFEAPLIVIVTPNVAFISNRIALLFGRFNYTDRGILDIQHRRLFNRVSLRRTLDDCGYQVEKIVPVGIPWEAVIGGRLGRFLQQTTNRLAAIWPSAFAFQHLVTCRPMPGVQQILSTREQLGPNAEIVPVSENEFGG